MIVIDDFLAPSQWDQFTYEGLWYKPKGYQWCDVDQPVRTIWEEIATYIWMYVDSREYVDLESFDGIEHWTNIMDPDGYSDLPIHYDKDEYLWRETGQVITPSIGSVLYAHDKMPEGGFLEILNEDMTVRERLAPVPNRLIIFNSGELHRVTPTTSGIRKVFATNIWPTKPSEENFES